MQTEGSRTLADIAAKTRCDGGGTVIKTFTAARAVSECGTPVKTNPVTSQCHADLHHIEEQHA